jgi:hypothetical protein
VLSQELFPQDLARHATPSHRIDVEVGESCFDNMIPACEDSLVVFKHGLEKFVLDVLPPEWFSIILLESLHFIPIVRRAVLRTIEQGSLRFRDVLVADFERGSRKISPEVLSSLSAVVSPLRDSGIVPFDESARIYCKEVFGSASADEGLVDVRSSISEFGIALHVHQHPAVRSFFVSFGRLGTYRGSDG